MKRLSWLLAAASFASAAANYTADADQKVEVSCACVLATSLCELKVFDQLSGAQRQTWTQSNFAKAGVPIDLSAACYRKRDADTGGQGLCCVGTEEHSTIERLFKGELVK
jgi:hypothetical protein